MGNAYANFLSIQLTGIVYSISLQSLHTISHTKNEFLALSIHATTLFYFGCDESAFA